MVQALNERVLADIPFAIVFLINEDLLLAEETASMLAQGLRQRLGADTRWAFIECGKCDQRRLKIGIPSTDHSASAIKRMILEVR